MKNSLLTMRYKKGRIQTYYNRETEKVEVQVQVGLVSKDCRTIQGAKREISKMMMERENKTGDFIGA